MPTTTMFQVQEKETDPPLTTVRQPIIRMQATSEPHCVVYQRKGEAQLHVWDLNQQSHTTLYCTSSDPKRVAVSPFLPHIYECAEDLIVRNLHTGRELWRFSPPPGFQFSTIVAGPQPNQVGILIESRTYSYFSIWGVESGKEGIHIPLFRTPSQHRKNEIQRVQISPDGEMLLLQRNGQLHRWSLSTGQRLPALPCTPPRITHLAFARKLPLLATLYPNEVAVWNWERPTHNPLMFTLQGQHTAVELSPCGKVLATGDNQGLIKLWRVDRGLKLGQWHTRLPIRQLLFTEGASELLAGHSNGEVSFWDTEALGTATSKQPIPSIPDAPQPSHIEETRMLRVLEEITPDNFSKIPTLMRMLQQWEAKVGITDFHRWVSIQVVEKSHFWRFQHHNTLPKGRLRFGLNRAGTYLAVWCFEDTEHGSQPQHVQLWEVETGRCVKNIDLKTLHNLWSAADPRTLIPEHYGTFERPILLKQQDEGTAWGRNYTTLVRWHHRHLQFLNTTPGQQRALLHCADLQAIQPSPVQSPLSIPPANLGDLTSPNAAFAAYNHASQWDWIVAFNTGLIVCPPRSVKEMSHSLCLVLDDRHAWPVQWLVGTEKLECHGTWHSALKSKKLPRPFPRLLKKLRRA